MYLGQTWFATEQCGALGRRHSQGLDRGPTIEKQRLDGLPSGSLRQVTKPTTARPATVAILGSCVTRDAFEFADPAEFTVEVYLARTALASFLGRRSETFDPEYDRIASNFQKRMVRSDVLKTGRNQLRVTDFDVLIYDPIDERFALALFEDAGIATISSEFQGLAVPSSEYTVIAPWSEEHFARWKAGWETFMRLLDETGARDKLVVHAARWAEKVEGSESPSADPTAIAKANAWLERAEERMKEDIPEERIIRVSEALQLVDAEHRWGISPFHYVEGYYHDFLERLRQSLSQAARESETDAQ